MASESPNLPKADVYRKGIRKNLSDFGKYETAGRYGGSVVRIYERSDSVSEYMVGSKGVPGSF